MVCKTLRQQYAALPYTFSGGETKILLITSRETRRWIIPKGWPEKGMSPCEVAAQEAFEEAGVLGQVSPCSIGRFSYIKRLEANIRQPCVVDVFLLKVLRELANWPEKPERNRRWMRPEIAAQHVVEAGLADILHHSEDLIFQNRPGAAGIPVRRLATKIAGRP